MTILTVDEIGDIEDTEFEECVEEFGKYQTYTTEQFTVLLQVDYLIPYIRLGEEQRYVSLPSEVKMLMCECDKMSSH